MDNLILFIIPLLLWGSHYAGLTFDVKSKRNIEILQSLAAGISIGYVFLILIPEVNRVGLEARVETMSLMLFGFVFFHSALKFVFKQKDLRRKEVLVDEIHLLAVSVYNFFITFSLIELIKNNTVEGLLLLFLITVHSTLSELSHHELHHHENRSLKTPTILLAAFAGALVPIFIQVDMLLRSVIFSFTAGAIIYISIREELPNGNKGKPFFFIIGAIFIAVLVLLLR